VVIYPRPTDIEAFETVYNRDHVPMAVAKLGGKTKIVATRVLVSPAGEPPFHRIAELYFPSMEVLEQTSSSDPTLCTRLLHFHVNRHCCYRYCHRVSDAGSAVAGTGAFFLTVGLARGAGSFFRDAA
jgi:uncharacterized protein (TIGR02118 family)